MSSGLSRPNQHIFKTCKSRGTGRKDSLSGPGRPNLHCGAWISQVTVETQGLGSASMGYGKHLQDFEEGSVKIQLLSKGSLVSLWRVDFMGATSSEVTSLHPRSGLVFWTLEDKLSSRESMFPQQNISSMRQGTAVRVTTAPASCGDNTWHTGVQ